MRTPTLRRRLTRTLVGVGLISTLLGGATVLVYEIDDEAKHARQAAEEAAQTIADQWGTGAMNSQDPAWARALLSDPRYCGIALIDGDGKEIVSVAGEHQGIVERFVIDKLGFERDRRVGKSSGTRVVVTASATPLVERTKRIGILIAGVLAVTSLLGLLFSRRLHRRISDQLLDLAHAVNAVSSRKDYSIRALRRSDDEVGILVDTFNHMLTQIELQDVQLKNEVERAEAAKVAKAQFLATMSHEIRTPINGILGMTQLLLDSDLNHEQRDFAQTVSRSAEGLLAIINDILDFSKGEAGRHQIEEIAFSPSKLIDECVETVAIVACEKEIELVCQVDDKIPNYVRGDPARLRQVVLNLLSNALKFTSEGEIVVRVAFEEDLGKRLRVRFEVQDTGIGIPKDRLDRLFRSFSQVDASSNRKYGGTGLGLAISKQLVEAMGGTMFVRTKEGVGSIFGFKLEVPPDAEHVNSEEIAPPEDLHILVVDPNATSRNAIAKMLRKQNRVDGVSNGSSARKVLIESTRTGDSYDLVLLDIRVGDAFLAPFTGEIDPPVLPLILLAPVNQLSTASAVEWQGHVTSVAKPVRRTDLLWCISEALKVGKGGGIPAALPSPFAVEENAPLAMSASESTTDQPVVLVAEDNLVNQKITTKFLDKLGVQWELAGDGEEALAIHRTGRVSMILMDVQMPVMDGLEATMAIRRIEEMSGERVPIVALTANVLEDDRNRAYKAGFDDYLAKPVKLEELEQTLNKWLRSDLPLAM